MKKYISALFILFSALAHGQALRDINYNYLYNPDEGLTFNFRPVKQNDSWKILYQFQLKDTTERLKDYIIEWQGREALNNKEGKVLSGVNNLVTSETAQLKTGIVTISFPDAPKILVARVINTVLKRAWIFYAHLEVNYPVNNFLAGKNYFHVKPFSSINQQVALGDSSNQWIISYYNDNFPAGAPGFSEGQGKVSKVMKADSVLTIKGGDPINFFAKGLYLFQKDTMVAEGFAVRAEKDYPRYTQVENLAAPFIYICTKQEYDQLELAKGNKKAFDRTVLNITGDADRARTLIRNYFKRVELANQYFTSYKEGWKTDRGMIYIIFGLPNEVFRFYDREVWTYKNTSYQVTFNFTKASSVFDPENYVLIREKKYQETWYEVIDLWRNARF